MKARPARFFVPATLALSIITGIHMVARAADDGGTAAAADGGTDDASVNAGDAARTPTTATCGGGGPHADEMTLFGAGCC